MEINLFVVITIFSLMGTYLPLTRSKKWWVVGQTYFRQWYFFLNVFLFVVWLFYVPFTLASAAVTILCGLGAWLCFIDIIPFTRFYSKEINDNTSLKDKEVLSILIYNVREDNDKYDKLLELQKQVDPSILLLMETNNEWASAVTSLESSYADLISEIRNDTYGLMMFSKIKYQKSDINYMTSKDVPSADVKISLNGHTIQLIALHPKPPIPGEAKTSRQKDQEFKAASKSLRNSKGNCLQIVLGDLNDVVWSRASKLFKKETGLKDPRVGRGTFSTFPTYAPVRFPIDQIFCSPLIELIVLTRMPNIGSDHYPIYVSLAIPKP